jgi:hypothetical protein
MMERDEDDDSWRRQQFVFVWLQEFSRTKLPITSMRLSNSNVPQQFCNVQGGFELDDESSSHGEESATLTRAEDCTTATPESS